MDRKAEHSALDEYGLIKVRIRVYLGGRWQVRDAVLPGKLIEQLSEGIPKLVTDEDSQEIVVALDGGATNIILSL